MGLSTGARLGVYEVISRLGSGGIWGRSIGRATRGPARSRRLRRRPDWLFGIFCSSRYSADRVESGPLNQAGSGPTQVLIDDDDVAEAQLASLVDQGVLTALTFLGCAGPARQTIDGCTPSHVAEDVQR